MRKVKKRPTSTIRVNSIDSDDPFGLAPKPKQTEKREEEKKRSTSNHRPGRDPKEIFIELNGIKSENRVVEYDAELNREDRERQDAEREHQKSARKTFHRSDRSSSRASASSAKAERKLKHMSTSIYENEQTVNLYNESVKAIDDAAFKQAKTFDLKMSGAGIDAVRNKQVKDRAR